MKRKLVVSVNKYNSIEVLPSWVETVAFGRKYLVLQKYGDVGGTAYPKIIEEAGERVKATWAASMFQLLGVDLHEVEIDVPAHGKKPWTITDFDREEAHTWSGGPKKKETA